MRRYLRVFRGLVNLAVKRFLENRANAIGMATSTVVGLALSIYFTNIIFSYTPELRGWTQVEVLMVLGVYRVVGSLFSLLFQRSINNLPASVHRGELDLLLTKPFNSQFFLSFRLIRVYDLISVLAGVGLIAYCLDLLQLSLSLLDWVIFGINLSLGILILYGLYFSIATLSVWFGQFTALQELYFFMREPLSKPINILGRVPSFILTFIIPLGFVVTVPVEVFLKKAPIYYLGLEIIFAAIFLSFSAWFWNYSMRRYTSASS